MYPVVGVQRIDVDHGFTALTCKNMGIRCQRRSPGSRAISSSGAPGSR
jgi:hypothetical protein